MAETNSTGSGWKSLGSVKKSKSNKSYIEVSTTKRNIEAVEELLKRLRTLEKQNEGKKIASVRLALVEPKRDGEFKVPEFVLFNISLPPVQD